MRCLGLARGWHHSLGRYRMERKMRSVARHREYDLATIDGPKQHARIRRYVW